MNRLTIGTRGSALALWQANYVRDALREAHEDLQVELKVIHTKGDKVLSKPLHAMPDKGLFTKELETALLAKEVDLAVHSLKDLPTELPKGLALAAVPAREDPADVLIAKTETTLDTLESGATILTGSLRRGAQVLHRRPDLKVAPVRGNVETRLRKMRESDASGIILARAGIVRLGLADCITERLDPGEFLPACGQGALGIEIRAGDQRVADLLSALENAPAHAAAAAERAYLAALGGGCQVPIGAFASLVAEGATLTVTGMVASLDGSKLIRRSIAAPYVGVEAARTLGWQLADELRDAGCGEILEQVAAAIESSENRQ